MEHHSKKETTTTDRTERISESDGSSQREEEEHMTRKAWLACIALAFVQNAAFQPIVIASITKKIDDVLGPATYYNWIMIGYSIVTTLVYPITGGLSDIFGRRAFLVAGSCITVIGFIIGLVGNSIPMIIVSMIIQGLGSGAQQLAGACIGEIVPKKDRGNAQAAMDFMILPWNVFGNLMGMSMIKRYKLGYKINFIIGIVLNVLATTFLMLFYNPERRPLPYGRTKMQELARIDWTGMFLYTAAIVLILVALSVGGIEVPYNKPGFYLNLVAGIIALIALFLWEWKGAKEPFFARTLFTGRAKKLPFYFILVFITGMTMYSSMALWPQQVQGMYFSDPDKIGLCAITTGAGSALGGILGGVLLGKTWFFETRYLTVFGCALKVASDALLTRCTPDTLAMAIGAAFMGSLGMGIAALAVITATQLSCAEKDIGLATLLMQSLRSAGGSTALAVYANLIQEAFKTKIATIVVPFISQYMGKIKDIVEFFRAITTGRLENARAQPGVDPRAVEITVDRMKYVWTAAFQKIYYTSIAFAALAMILSFFCENVSDLMTHSIEVHMQGDPEVIHRHQHEKAVGDVEAHHHPRHSVAHEEPLTTTETHTESAVHDAATHEHNTHDEKALEHNSNVHSHEVK